MRAVLNKVALHEVDAGIVHVTDIHWGRQASVGSPAGIFTFLGLGPAAHPDCGEVFFT